MEEAHPDLTVKRYEIQTFEAREMLAKLLHAYEAELGPVPSSDTRSSGTTTSPSSESPRPRITATRTLELLKGGTTFKT